MDFADELPSSFCRALKIDHRRVIDTSLVFGYAGLPTAIPSLGDLCRAVLEVRVLGV
jgi:hypothetical protein